MGSLANYDTFYPRVYAPSGLESEAKMARAHKSERSGGRSVNPLPAVNCAAIDKYLPHKALPGKQSELVREPSYWLTKQITFIFTKNSCTYKEMYKKNLYINIFIYFRIYAPLELDVT